MLVPPLDLRHCRECEVEAREWRCFVCGSTMSPGRYPLDPQRQRSRDESGQLADWWAWPRWLGMHW